MKQYGIETLHEHRASLEQKARFSGFPCALGNFPTEIKQELAS